MAVEHELEFTWRGLSLSGNLTRREGEGPHPAVLLLQGSGPADRDADGYFAPLRQTFLEWGLATFAFDKPGCGRSTGDWRDHGLFDRADQAAAAIEALGTVDAIDPARIGVWGHSQGGWLAQILASRHPELAFAVANSGPSIGVVEQNLFGVEHTMRAEGWAEGDIDRALALVDRVHRAAGEGVDGAAIERRFIDPIRDEAWYADQFGGAGAKDWGFLCHLVVEAYQPTEALTAIECPFLAIYGGRDVLVPAWQGVEESGRALEQGGTPDATVVVFPGANHRIKDPATDRFVDGYLDLLGGWAAKRV